jgi:hypothetical protein
VAANGIASSYISHFLQITIQLTRREIILFISVHVAVPLPLMFYYEVIMADYEVIMADVARVRVLSFSTHTVPLPQRACDQLQSDFFLMDVYLISSENSP